jgi:hypothetical protein
MAACAPSPTAHRSPSDRGALGRAPCPPPHERRGVGARATRGGGTSDEGSGHERRGVGGRATRGGGTSDEGWGYERRGVGARATRGRGADAKGRKLGVLDLHRRIESATKPLRRDRKSGTRREFSKRRRSSREKLSPQAKSWSTPPRIVQQPLSVVLSVGSEVDSFIVRFWGAMAAWGAHR